MFSTVKSWLSLDDDWSPKTIPAGFAIPEPKLLFERLDKKMADKELLKLQAS